LSPYLRYLPHGDRAAHRDRLGHKLSFKSSLYDRIMKAYFEQIYEHIGYLFYAIAAEHGKLNAVTFDRLNRLIDQQWYPAGNGQSLDAQLVNHLHSGLRKAFDASMWAEEAFDRFQSYFGVHSLPIGRPLRSKIFATANMLASEFSWNGKQSKFVSSLAKMFAVNPIALI
jgi:hypothetical protein